MKWWPSPCKKGDMIRVRTGAVYHYGIFVSEDEVIQFGPPPVSVLQGSTADFQVMSTDIQYFSCGAIVEVAVPETPQERRRFAPGKTVRLARKRMGESGYDLIHNNCEHFAYECVYGIRRSTQAEEARRRWQTRPVLNVYILPLDAPLEEAPVYPPEREQDIRSSGGLAAQKRAVWKALEAGYAHAYGQPFRELSFQKDPAGKWTCQGCGISLTHTENAVAAAISSSPVGVDMESEAAFRAKYDAFSRDLFCKKACTPRELDQEPAPDLTGFLRLWTRKESIFKCRGTGCFTPQTIESTASDVRTVRFVLQDTPMVLSVCGEKAASLCCYVLDRGTPCRILTENL